MLMDNDRFAQGASLEIDNEGHFDIDHHIEAVELLRPHFSRSADASPRLWLKSRLCINRVNRRSIQYNILRRLPRLLRGRVFRWLRMLLQLILSVLCFFLVIIVFYGIFLPSYSRLPLHYILLRARVSNGWETGSANLNQEKVFIAASLFDPDGKLARGQWANNVLQLIHILGPDNVYLSVYENDSGSEGDEALSMLEPKVPCNHTLVSETHLDLDSLPHVQLPNGILRVKRIDYLAEVRNRALKPLENSDTRFDKLLYLNDIIFDPIDAAQLLFSTNVNSNGKAQYRSACAVDFSMPFKFYDTFATRDHDGYSMGVPFFPWFSAAGGYRNLDELLSDRDAVQVRSCWGGMVAFNATFFQNWADEALAIPTAANHSPLNISAPYRFRAEEDLWWEASECCLIQADIQNPDSLDSEVYMNPFIRVAYDSRTFSWLQFTRRFEKLYPPIHFIADIMASLPHHNPRREEIPWRSVEEVTWVHDDHTLRKGAWHKISRVAKHDGFCGRRGLHVMKNKMSIGQKNYESIQIPAPKHAINSA